MHPYTNFTSHPSPRTFVEMVSAVLHLPEKFFKRMTYACAAMMIVILAMIVFAATSASAASCANADLAPATAAELRKAEAATRCLINAERRSHGLRATRYNKKLRKSSIWQGKDMIRHEYFDHNRSGGPSFTGRISRFGYGRKSNGYSLGENLAWAPQSVATPSEMVRMWMDSPGHRANILRSGFKEQGVAAIYSDGDVGGDYEDSGGPFVIYVSQFGTRY